jgi:hypothetical protein
MPLYRIAHGGGDHQRRDHHGAKTAFVARHAAVLARNAGYYLESSQTGRWKGDELSHCFENDRITVISR